MDKNKEELFNLYMDKANKKREMRLSNDDDYEEDDNLKDLLCKNYHLLVRPCLLTREDIKDFGKLVIKIDQIKESLLSHL